MTLIKTSVLSAVATVIQVLSGFVATKIIAIYVGPSGLAFIGQFQNFIALVMALGSGSINTGVIKYTAEYRNDPEEKKKLWSTALRISFIGTFIGAVLLLIFYDRLSLLFFKDDSYGSLFIIFALTLGFYVLNSLLMAVLNGQKEIKKLITIKVTSSLTTLLLIAILTYWYGLYGTLLSLILTQSLIFVVTLVFVFKSHWFKRYMFTETIHIEYLKKLGKYTAMAIVASLSAPLSELIIRNYIGSSLSWNDAGYWQAIWKISSVYLMIITMTLSIYYLPKLSEIKKSTELRKEIFSGYKIIVPLTILLAAIVYISRDLIIILLFTEEFMPMRELFAYQLLGDVLKIISWLISFLMVAKAMTKVFIITEIIGFFSYIFLSFFFIDRFGLIGAPMAFAFNMFLYGILIFWIFKDLILYGKFNISKNSTQLH